MDWSKLDPNVVMSWAAVVAGAIGWLYHRAKGDKTQSARDVLDSIVAQALNTPGISVDNVKMHVETLAREALTKRGISGKVADALVHEFVEFASAQLHRRVDIAARDLARADAAAQATLRDITAPPPLVGADGKVVPRENWAAKPGELGSGVDAAGEITGP